MTRRILTACAALLLASSLSGGVSAEEATKEKPARVDFAKRVAFGEALATSFVHVEVTFRYDKGEAPIGITTGSHEGYSGLIAEQRPWELTGFLVSPTHVVTRDLQMEKRFIEKYEVVFGEHRVGARAAAFGFTESATILELDAPLAGAKPLEFDAAGKGPYSAVWYGLSNTRWKTSVTGTLEIVGVSEGKPTARTWTGSVIVDRRGVPVGLATRDELAPDGPWRGSPLDWKLIDAASLDQALAAQAKRADQTLRHVKLRFRSPRQKESGEQMFSFGDDDAGAETERDACGVVLAPDRILVLARLDAKTTARLESIEIRSDGAPTLAGTFVATLKDYGALVVEPETPIETCVTPSTRDLRSYENEIILGTRMLLQGEKRVTFQGHYRLESFGFGWKRQIVPQISGPEEDYYLFDLDGALISVPVIRRVEELRSRWSDPSPEQMPVQYLVEAVGNLDVHGDKSIVPLSAEEEERVAWLGVELQPLDQELARANEVSHLTQDGTTGAIVSFVYPESPAANVGIEPGAILIRIHDPDRAAPIDIAIETDYMAQYRAMYEQFRDQMPDEYASQFAQLLPWSSVDNDFNRMITDIGFDKPFVLEYVDAGEVKKAEMTVEQSPTHFEGAPTFKSEKFGFSVRDITFEVRRHFRRESDEPGVIVSKVEPGERAAVAGLRPYEVVLEIDGKVPASVDDIEKALAEKDEVQLKVKDRINERVVQIRAE